MSDNQVGNKVHNIIEYGLIIAMYYVTGGAFSYTNYSTQITVFFLVSAAIAIGTGAAKKILRRKCFIALYAMSLLLIIVPLLNNDSISTYIAIIMQLLIGAFIASVIPPFEFCKKFTRVMIFFATVSLVGFAIGTIYPSIATLFPLTIGDASVDYYNAGIYVFMRPKGYSSFFMTSRNAGICWEPGCYQCFLNIALLFLIEERRTEEVNHFYRKFIILIITICTTFSTTGMIILVMILAFNIDVWSGRQKISKLIIPIIGVMLGLIFLLNTDAGRGIITKIVSEFSGNGSQGQTLYSRISLEYIKYLFEGGFWFFGMSFSRFLTFGRTGLWNSIIHSILCLGIPFTVIQLIGYWKGCRRLVKKGTLLFIILLTCASTETLFWRVFFNTIAFYGWIMNCGMWEDSL